jgi:hypothetical protein
MNKETMAIGAATMIWKNRKEEFIQVHWIPALDTDYLRTQYLNNQAFQVPPFATKWSLTK